jgi:hypothetical protein
VATGQTAEGKSSAVLYEGTATGERNGRVVVFRRPLHAGVAEENKSKKKAAKQLSLEMPEALYGGVRYEYSETTSTS